MHAQRVTLLLNLSTYRPAQNSLASLCPAHPGHPALLPPSFSTPLPPRALLNCEPFAAFVRLIGSPARRPPARLCGASRRQSRLRSQSVLPPARPLVPRMNVDHEVSVLVGELRRLGAPNEAFGGRTTARLASALARCGPPPAAAAATLRACICPVRSARCRRSAARRQAGSGPAPALTGGGPPAPLAPALSSTVQVRRPRARRAL